MVDILLLGVCDFGGVGLEGAHGLGGVKLDFVVLVINKIIRAAEVSQPQIKLLVDQNVLWFYVPVGDPRAVQVLHRRNQV